MKKILSILCVTLMALLVLCACGGKKEPETQPQTEEQTTAAQTETQTETTTEAVTQPLLDNNTLVDIVFKDLRLSTAFAGDISVSQPDADGSVTVYFKLNNIDCNYVLDGYTGNILSKYVPQEALGEPANAMEPFERAVNTALGSLDGYTGGAQNIQTSADGNIITVDFDWNGNHYTFHYDTNQNILVD